MNAAQLKEVTTSINKILTSLIEQSDLNFLEAQSNFTFEELIDIIEKLIDKEEYSYAEELLLLVSNLEESPSIFSRLAYCQKKLKKIKDAKTSYENAIATDPLAYSAYYNYGVLLQENNEYDLAIAKYNSAIKLNPSLAEAYYNLGNICRDQNDFESAKAYYLKCIEINPVFENALYNLGVIYEKLGHNNSAEKCYNSAIELNNNNVEAHWNRSLLLLKNKNLIEGFKEFEWRLKKKELKRTFPFSKWNGEDLTNKKILVYCEQGFGDAIQFCRYLSDLIKTGCNVTLECRKELLNLFEINFPNIEVIERGRHNYSKNDFDFYLPLLSLPSMLKIPFENLDGKHYLFVDEAEKIEWQKKLLSNNKKNAGLVWKGNTNHQNDKERSIDPNLFNRLLTNKNYNFYSLQLEEKFKNKNLVDLTSEINSFGDTAALISNLDLVITVDTAVAHLSAALGIETWILIAYNSDWRWFTESEKSPWYDSIKLIRKKKDENWEGLIKKVSDKLKSNSEFTKLDIHKDIGQFLSNNDFEKVLVKVRALLKENENSEHAFNYLGILYLKQKKYLKAQQYFHKAISINDNFVQAYSNLGILHFENNDYEKAVELNDLAVQKNTNNPHSYYNLAYALQELGNIESAIYNYTKAVELKPDFADAWFNLSLLQLMNKNYSEGWSNYNKWISKTNNSIKRNFESTEWEGQNLNGKTLLVYSDQAYGDAIQFVRYLPLLKSYNGKVIYECPESLVDIFKEIHAVDEVISSNKLYSHDFNVPLMRLPEILLDDKKPELEVTYDVSISEEIYKKWLSKIINENKLKVGFVWTGNPYPPINKKRHMSIDDFSILFEVNEADFYSLQLGDDRKQLSKYLSKDNVFDFTSDIKTFEDTSAIIAAMDLVITIDTSVAHLAGTMEKPVWIMLAYMPDWRWSLKSSHCNWYPSMKLFRQNERSNWKEVINKVYTELTKLIKR